MPPGPITMPMDKVQERMASMSPQQLAAFMQFMQFDQENPADPETLFVIPETNSNEWREFFEKVLSYCGASYEGSEVDKEKKMELIAWEKRRWLMDDKQLDEYDMLYNATLLKDKGNTHFKARETKEALDTYVSAMRVFPLPDSMNNIAAAALKLKRYELAAQYATASLTMGLMENPQSRAKALYRRAQAYQHLGKLREAMADVEAALTIRPEDQALAEYQKALRLKEESGTRRHLDDVEESFEDKRHSTSGFTALDFVSAPASFRESSLPPVF